MAGRVLLSFLSLLFFLGILSGCERYYLSVSQQIISRSSLASSHVGTPDPKLANPPLGRELIISWHIPQQILEATPKVYLDVIYWNYTEGHFIYPIESRRGYRLYTLVAEPYLAKEGILSYRARIETADGKIYKSWQHQLWVDLIRIDQEEQYTPPTEPSFP